jgi:hypothetical protein
LLLHDVFAPDVLTKDPKNPLPKQVSDPPPSETIDGKQEWEVQEIIASKIKNGKLYYQVKWVGYDPDPTWYPLQNFDHARNVVKAFHGKNPKAPAQEKKNGAETDASLSYF